MSTANSFSARVTRAMHRYHARLSTRRVSATGFVSQPEPRSIGSFAKGRQLCAGNVMFAGHLVELDGASLWAVRAPDPAFLDEAHGFGWLDDLAAVGDGRARICAQDWVWSNPEELLDVFALLTWAAQSLREAAMTPPAEMLEAMEKIAPTLRTLRHSDGALARFHGGGRGVDGRLDQALVTSAVKRALPDGLSMGFARLSGGRTSVIVDASPPPPAEETGHNGYARTHGLTHARTLELTTDGRGLAGEDMLIAVEDADKKRFDKRLDAGRLQGIDFAIRFHLHPDVDCALDMGGTAVSVALRSGEIWVFRHDNVGKLSLEPSVYLEKGRLSPRATKQIVLSGRAMDYATRIRWSLAKTQDTAVGVRDITPDDDYDFD